MQNKVEIICPKCGTSLLVGPKDTAAHCPNCGKTTEIKEGRQN